MSMKRVFYQVSKRNRELIPIVAIVGTAVVGAVGFFVYNHATKADIVMNKRKATMNNPHDLLDPERPTQKLITINQKYQRIPELEQLQKEIGTYNPYAK